MNFFIQIFHSEKDSDAVCLNENEECYTTPTAILDPRLFNLTEDFIFVEKDWGSLFYKHIGRHNRTEAERLCSEEGEFVHLPVPRFADENMFYREVFGSKGLWFSVLYETQVPCLSTRGDPERYSYAQKYICI